MFRFEHPDFMICTAQPNSGFAFPLLVHARQRLPETVTVQNRTDSSFLRA
jgi:hypothetical protein